MWSIVLGGDVMLGRTFNDLKPRSPWGLRLQKLISEADLTAVNLETSITDSVVKWPGKAFNFRLSPHLAFQILPLSGIDHVALANNHIEDFGLKGLKDTMETLDMLNITHSGAGLDISGATQLVVHQLFRGDDRQQKPLKVGFMSFSDQMPEWAATPSSAGIAFVDIYGDNQKQDLNKNQLFGWKDAMEKVAAAHNLVDLLIVQVHQGPNWEWTPSQNVKDFDRALIESGADIIVGTSAHHVQGSEVYRVYDSLTGKDRTGLILYGLGDMVDDYAIDQNYRSDLGAVVELLIEKEPAASFVTKNSFLLNNNDGFDIFSGKVHVTATVHPIKISGYRADLATDFDDVRFVRDRIGFSRRSIF